MGLQLGVLVVVLGEVVPEAGGRAGGGVMGLQLGMVVVVLGEVVEGD